MPGLHEQSQFAPPTMGRTVRHTSYPIDRIVEQRPSGPLGTDRATGLGTHIPSNPSPVRPLRFFPSGST